MSTLKCFVATAAMEHRHPFVQNTSGLKKISRLSPIEALYFVAISASFMLTTLLMIVFNN